MALQTINIGAAANDGGGDSLRAGAQKLNAMFTEVYGWGNHGAAGYLTDVAWTDVTGKPTFAAIATTGAYADLTGAPSVPSALADLSDWPASPAEGSILVYRSGVPTFEAKPVSSGAPAWGDVTGTLTAQTDLQAALDGKATAAQGALADSATQPGDLATVATSGSYNDLADNPALGTAAASNTGDFAAASHQHLREDLTTQGFVVRKTPWDASTGTFPGGGTALNGDQWRVSVAGTVNGVEFKVDDLLMAVANNASTTTYAANWERHKAVNWFATAAQGALAATALQDAGAFATSAQGALADSALQDASAFATAAQGDKADLAVLSDVSDLPGMTAVTRHVITSQATYNARTPPADDETIIYDIVG